MALPKIEKKLRTDTPLVGYPPYGQIHPHSTGNPDSTAQNEADNQYNNRPVAFFTHVVGNGRIIQVAPTGRGAYDVGGDWNMWTYAAVEIIESHKTKEEFLKDYRIYVELLRTLADEAKIPKKLDSGEIGINTHDYCRRHQPNNGTDHVDPYPYLEKWGISKAQFKKDIENGINNSDANAPSQPKPQPSKPNPTSKPNNSLPKGFTAEKGTFINGSEPIQARVGNYGFNAPKGGMLPARASIKYDGWINDGTYVWVVYTGFTGDKLFLPVRHKGTPWGDFK